MLSPSTPLASGSSHETPMTPDTHESPMTPEKASRHSKMPRLHHEGDGTNSLSTRCCDTKATAPAGINAQMSPKGVPKLHIVDGNAQIEKLRFDCAGASGSSVRHAGKHVKSNTNCTQTNTLRIHVFFVKSDTKDCQNGHIFSPHFTMISSVIFKRQKTKRSFGCGISMRAPWTHLR